MTCTLDHLKGRPARGRFHDRTRKSSRIHRQCRAFHGESPAVDGRYRASGTRAGRDRLRCAETEREHNGQKSRRSHDDHGCEPPSLARRCSASILSALAVSRLVWALMPSNSVVDDFAAAAVRAA